MIRQRIYKLLVEDIDIFNRVINNNLYYINKI